MDELLDRTAAYAAEYVSGLPTRPVAARANLDELRRAFDHPLPDGPTDPASVVDQLIEAADPGVVATGSPRYFGFVIGGALPAALAADWLTSTWDQNAGLYAGGPAASVAEEVAGRWLLELLGLPAAASFSLVTGCQMAHFTALAAARHHVLAKEGWDVNRQGLAGSPPIRVVAGQQRHVTLDRALRYLGVGTEAMTVVPADVEGRISAQDVADALGAGGGPSIVCAQAGEVNTGAFDPIEEVCSIAHQRGAWVHIDGAFGLWAAASPALAQLVAGAAEADSWATDCHKWLNVPYDCGLAACAHPDDHRAAMGTHADYLVQAAPGGPRDQLDWTPEFSRRARGFAVYAAIRSLGRSGVAELVERSCANARRFARALAAHPGVEVLNEVVLDQVLVRFVDPAGDSDALTRRVIERVQTGGTCWMSGTVWQGKAAMRISVVNYQTTAEDVDQSVAAVLAAMGT